MYNSIDKVDQRDDYFQCSPILGRYAIGYSLCDWHFQNCSGFLAHEGSHLLFV
jgi:hypothetical protein